MEARHAAIGSTVFFFVAPGLVAGLLPWLVGRSTANPVPWPVQGLGLMVGLGGLTWLLVCFVDFVAARGTPAPIAPTERLVVEGPYRYVRNPMYVGVIVIILGQTLWHGSPWLLVYGALVWTVTAAFVRMYEEPSLRRQFGSDYVAYQAAVPAWFPRLRPWTGSKSPG